MRRNGLIKNFYEKNFFISESLFGTFRWSKLKWYSGTIQFLNQAVSYGDIITVSMLRGPQKVISCHHLSHSERPFPPNISFSFWASVPISVLWIGPRGHPFVTKAVHFRSIDVWELNILKYFKYLIILSPFAYCRTKVHTKFLQENVETWLFL